MAVDVKLTVSASVPVFFSLKLPGTVSPGFELAAILKSVISSAPRTGNAQNKLTKNIKLNRLFMLILIPPLFNYLFNSNNINQKAFINFSEASAKFEELIAQIY
jgi:hypothetical protein